MADCKSPIVSARCQPLRHNVAIRSVFNKALVTSINTFYWGEDLEAPRSMEASSSSLLQLPSCGEGIQTRKNSPNTNWQVIDATATSKEVAGTDNGASSWLNMSISSASHWTLFGFSFLIASEQNKLSITTLFVFYSTSTKAQHCTWTQNHELTAHVVDADALLYMCHFSSEKCSHNKMKEIPFEVCTFFKYAWRRSSWDTQHLIQIQIQTKHALKSVQQIHVGNAIFWGTGSIGKGLPTSSKPPLSSCKVSNQDIQIQPLLALCYWLVLLAFTYQRAQQRNKGMAENIQSLSSKTSPWMKVIFCKYRSTNPEE